MPYRITGALLLAVALAGCNAGPVHPAGWHRVAGTGRTRRWTIGNGKGLREFATSNESFSGTLNGLASQQVVAFILHHHGAKLVGVKRFAPCPGLAAVARFTEGRRVLYRGFTVRGSRAFLITYTSAEAGPIDASALAAMKKTLCTFGF